MNGFLIVDKPKGITSQGVVCQIKKKFNIKKCGHTGTLDPDATGVLVVAVGDATKMIRFLDEKYKQYETTIVFGYDSNTLDIYGNITKDIDMSFTLVELDKALTDLKHLKYQTPPMVSAIKVNGKKLYEYERQNIKLDVEQRPIEITEIKRLSDLRVVDNHLEVDIKITCSKGFYVRSFGRDLGLKLGGCAILKELKRIYSGRFHLNNSTTLENISKDNLIDILDVFTDFDKLEVNDYIAKLVSNGVMLDERQIITDKVFYVYNNNSIIAIYEPIGNNKYKPVIIYKKGSDLIENN